MARLLKKKAGRLEMLPVEAPMGEPTRYGWQVWPDRAEGRGPIYFAKYRRPSGDPILEEPINE